MRVLLASYTPPRRSTGMGAWGHAMAEALARRGHTCTLWFDADVATPPAGGRTRFLLAPRHVARRLLEDPAAFDVVVLHEACAATYAAARRRTPALPPLVVVCHNVESKVHRVMAEAARAGLARTTPWSWVSGPLLRHPLTDGAIRRADAVACLSAEDHRYIAETLEVLPGRIVAMTNGVDPGLVRDRPRRDGPARRVLFIGGWLDVKGRRVLPPLWRAVRERVPDAALTLVGTGAGPEAVAGAFAPPDRGSVRVVPRLDDPAAVAAQVDGHDVLLAPSLSEGSPLALLEAMAAGTPVVASARGGIPDIVTDGREGRLFDPLRPADGAAALAGLLADPAALERCGAAARARAARLTWDATAERMADAITRATERPA